MQVTATHPVSKKRVLSQDVAFRRLSRTGLRADFQQMRSNAVPTRLQFASYNGDALHPVLIRCPLSRVN